MMTNNVQSLNMPESVNNNTSSGSEGSAITRPHKPNLPCREPRLIEDFRAGYPRFSALLGCHNSFHVFRRFSRTRLRLLLNAQDKVALLEEELDKIDHEETAGLFLGANRRDRNAKRQDVFDRLRTSLADYDNQVKQTHAMMSLSAPRKRNIQNLRNWILGTSCISREESAFLWKTADLMSPSTPTDDALTSVEHLIEELFVLLQGLFGKNTPETTDDHIFIFSGYHLTTITRAIIACLVVALLLIPVIIIPKVNSVSAGIGVVFVAVAIFVFAVSLLSRSPSTDVFIAGSTYAAVLVVFVAGARNS